MSPRRRIILFRSMLLGCAAMSVVGIAGLFVFGPSVVLIIESAVFVLLAIGFWLALRDLSKHGNGADEG